MNNKAKTKYRTFGTIPRSIRNIAKHEQNRKKQHTNAWPLTFLACSGTSLKYGWVRVVLWPQTSPLSEMMCPCKYFSHGIVSKMIVFSPDIVTNIAENKIKNENSVKYLPQINRE